VATYTPIQSTVLTTSAATVSFNNIDQSYTDLIVVASIQTTAATGYLSTIQFNGDTTSGLYSTTILTGNGSSTDTSVRTSSKNYLQTASYGSVPSSTQSNTYDSEIWHIMNYSSSNTYKTCLGRVGSLDASTPGINLTSGLWRNFNPITSITFGMTSGNLAAGTTVSIYGLRNGSAKANGGNIITTDGTYWYHVFTSSGIFTPQAPVSHDILLVGGGGGGSNGGNYGGGGGAGKFTALSSQILAPQNYTITIGAGGAGSANGNATTITAGGFSQSATYGFTGSGVTGGNSGDGYTGGSGNNSSPFAGGGGAGSTQNGFNAVSSAGNGGAGNSTLSSWATATGTGVSGAYAGGGGGGANGSGAGAGAAGGGNGTNTNGANGSPATANTGSGGGGAVNNTGGTGGSGIVIVRYHV